MSHSNWILHLRGTTTFTVCTVSTQRKKRDGGQSSRSIPRHELSRLSLWSWFTLRNNLSSLTSVHPLVLVVSQSVNLKKIKKHLISLPPQASDLSVSNHMSHKRLNLLTDNQATMPVRFPSHQRIVPRRARFQVCPWRPQQAHLALV